MKITYACLWHRRRRAGAASGTRPAGGSHISKSGSSFPGSLAHSYSSGSSGIYDFSTSKDNMTDASVSRSGRNV